MPVTELDNTSAANPGGPIGIRMKRVCAFAGLFLVIIALYAFGLRGPFVFDDFPTLVDNAPLHISRLDPAAIWRAATSFQPGGSGRPLAMATFAINHAIGGLNPWGYKLTGILVHALNGLLVLALVLRVLKLAGVAERHRLAGAAAIAALWALHPLQVSSVLYVVQRMETLSLTFVLLALLAYLRGRTRQMLGLRGWTWLALCPPLVALGLACKETAALFPAYALALELTLLRFDASTPRIAHSWRWFYGLGCVLALGLFAFVVAPHYLDSDAWAGRDFNGAERLLSQLRILPMYLGQMLWPVPAHMPFYYDDFDPSRSLFSPVSTLFGGLLLVSLLLAGWLARRRMPMFALGIFWFFAAHAITSNVIPLELVFEHRNYFALLGILLSLADLVRRIPVKDGPGIKYAAVSALVIGVAVLGTIRAATWGDRLLLATDFASMNPHSARAAHELGVTYYEMADGSSESPFFSLAQQQFERESRLPQSTILAEQALILMAAGTGGNVEPGTWDTLLAKLRERPITPETTQGLFALLDNRYKGRVIDDNRLRDAFLFTFDRVTMPAYSYAQVADYATEYLHDNALAEHLLSLAVENSGEHPEYVEQLASALQKQGRGAQAEHVVEHARQLGIIDPRRPSNREAETLRK